MMMKPMMGDRIVLAERLLSMPALILTAERAVIAAARALDHARERLQEREDFYLLGERPPDGKNAETRAAQLRALTTHERGLVEAAASALCNLKAEYHAVEHEFSALRAVARLLTDPA